MNSSFATYSPLATEDDGTCIEVPEPVGDILGCMYPAAINYDSVATRDDLSCVFGTAGRSGEGGGSNSGGGTQSSSGSGSCCGCNDGMANLAMLVREQHEMQREQLQLLRNQTQSIKRIDQANECARFVRGEGHANRTCFMIPADVPDPTDEFQILPNGMNAAG